jgi:hypothetical protein
LVVDAYLEHVLEEAVVVAALKVFDGFDLLQVVLAQTFSKLYICA